MPEPLPDGRGSVACLVRHSKQSRDRQGAVSAVTGTRALLVLLALLFEPAEAVIDRIQPPDDFLIVGAILVLDLNQRWKGDAALQQKGR